MDPWSKGNYSRYIREASMAMEGLPEGVASPDKVPEQPLQAAPILKRRRRRNRGEIAKEESVLGVSTRGVNIGEGWHRGDPRGSEEGPWRGPGWGCATCPPGSLVVAPLPSLGNSGSFCCAEFIYIFPGIFGALLMAGKPEIQKQQKTETGNWVH